ncbi:E3 ubiquitin-protein ligase Os03g0188200-like [Phragmites australis]|uniref:E3 ubiquitin-protein ligase Os03g0188200-like n=1 Tax=Phragmites australis TaxID=29695 RepID=UPI002D76A715|nr:E3 ubiquitin-protein ligase Os03g0188200-like [Phragmites australis]
MAMARRRITPPLLVLLLLLLLSAAGPSLAQQSNSTRHSSHTAGGFTPTTIIVLAVLISALVLLTLFSIYINRCAPPRPPPLRAFRTAPHQTADGGAVHSGRRPRGLDKEIVESLPTAMYGDVKARVAAKSGPLECAVCLTAFEDHDELRVLPACCHVFHSDCINPWLAGAVTCPLCRADLTVPSALASTESCDLTARQEPVQEEPNEEQDDACLVGAFTPESVISFDATRSLEFHYRRTKSAMDMPDRHTLRLPEHVMKELAAVRRHRRAASLAGYPDALERTPRWLASFWQSMSWQRQSRTDSDAVEGHGGSKRVVPITGEPAGKPSGSGSGGDAKEKPELDALNWV